MKKFLIAILLITVLTSCVNNKNETTQETKKVQTINGEVEIPKNPKRIADVSGVSDMLYILGMKPVATADSDAYDYTKFPSYLEKELSGATIVGYPMSETVDIEGIIAKKPDLIIINPRQEKIFDQLNKIATTIIIEPTLNDWIADLKMVAKIFDKDEEAQKYITEYKQKSNEISKKIKEVNGEDKTYFTFLTAGNDYYLFTKAAYGDILYNDLGLKAPENLPKQENISLPVASLEGLSAINADVLIVLASEEDKKTLENSPVWQNMKAVKENNIVWLSQSPYFNQAYSTYGKLSLLDELEKVLTKK